jgi:hypothetical protein
MKVYDAVQFDFCDMILLKGKAIPVTGHEGP